MEPEPRYAVVTLGRIHTQEYVILGLTYRADGEPLRIGDGAVIRSHSALYADTVIGARFNCGHGVTVRAHARIGDDCTIGNGTTVEGRCVIGDACRIMSNCYIPTNTTLGSHIFMGPNCVCLNDKYPFRHHALPKEWQIPDRPIGPTIGDDVCIGGGVTILPGVAIGEGAFIAAGCVVHRDVPPWSLAVGVPADIRPLPEHLKTENDRALLLAPALWDPEEVRGWRPKPSV